MPPTETLPMADPVDMLRRRVDDLEAALAALKVQLQARRDEARGRPWWEGRAGAFSDDPGFEEMVDFGKQWRDAERAEARSRHDEGGGETPT